MSSLRKISILKLVVPIIVILACVLFGTHLPAKAANPTTINFQGKVVNSDGTNVSNGTYTFVFRLYDAASPTTTSTCALNSSCWWEETDSLTVANGVFQVELGSGCAFTSACNSSHSGINFNTNNALYLTMKFNSDAAGFMSPTVHLTSSPYALNSDTVGGIASSSLARNDTTNSFSSLNTFNGGLTISESTGEQGLISAVNVPTVDMLALTNAGQGVTTAGINGLSINYVGGAAAVEASGERIDLTGGTTAGAGAIWNGLRVTQNTITPGTTVGDIKLETAALTQTTGATTNILGLSVGYNSTAGALATSTTGASNIINWSGLSVASPTATPGIASSSITTNGLNVTTGNITQTAGTAAANGINLTLGTITTGGTQTGLTITGSNSNSVGTQYGINVGALTAGAATEYGINIGAGWDRALNVSTAGASAGIQVTATSAPTVDQVTISNSGQGVTTAGVSNLQLTYSGGAAAVEASGQRIDFTGGTTAGAGAIWNGLRITQGTVTAGTTVQDIKLETAALTQTTANTTNITGLSVGQNSTAGALATSTTGASNVINWNGLSVVTPTNTPGIASSSITATGLNITTAAVTQTAGTAISNGLSLNLGTLTTGGKQTGLNFANITAPTVGQTAGLYFGSASSTSWSDLHSSTAANNNFANIVITKSAAGASANNFTIKNDASTMAPLFELRDLNANTAAFGGLAVADAFVSKQSYFGEEFNIPRNFCSETPTTSATNHAGVLGDGGSAPAAPNTNACTSTTGTFSSSDIADTATTGTGAFCTSLANTAPCAINTATNGFIRISCTGASGSKTDACLATNNNATAGGQLALFNTGNLPQVTVKFRTSTAIASGAQYFVGISNQATAVKTPANTLKGAYISNCTVPTSTTALTCGTGWVGVLSDGTTAGSTTVSCPSTDSDGSSPQATNFMYTRIEFRKNTATASSAEVQYFVDYDVTNGIHETSCGTITTQNATPMGNTGMGAYLMAESNSTTATNLDVDYFRVWQDDAPTTDNSSISTPATDTPTTDNSQLTTPPLTLDSVGTVADNNAFFDFNAATSDDAVFNHDVYVHGTLYVDKIKANKIEGLEVSTAKLSALSKTSTSQPNSSSSSSVSPTSSDDNLTVEGKLIANGGLTINSSASFANTAEFQKLVTFLDNVSFNGDVSFLGRTTFNSDTGGFAVIKAGQQSVDVKYDKSYDNPPIVGLAIDNGQFANYSYTYIKDDNNKIIGFTINLQQTAENDIEFSWSSINIKDAKTTTSPVQQ